MLLIEDK